MPIFRNEGGRNVDSQKFKSVHLCEISLLRVRRKEEIEMKAHIIKKAGCLLTFFALVVPMAVADNRCKCSPTEWDFGDVSIGSSSTVIFTLTNFDETEVAIRNIGIVNTTSDSFRIHIDVPPPSIYIPKEKTYDIIVEFSPSSLGDHSAELRISTNTKVS